MSFELDAMRFTASVMGNPDYLKAIKDIRPAKDRRREGIERLNSFHAHAHEKRSHNENPKWSR